MTDTQLYILIAIPLLAAAMNWAGFIYLGTRIDNQSARIDRQTESIAALTERTARLETSMEWLKGEHAK